MTSDDGAVETRAFRELMAGKQGGGLFRQLIDSAPDAMVIVGVSGVILLINRRTEELFGYARDELVGQPIELLVPERFRPAHIEHRARFAAAPKSRAMGSGFDLFGRRKDGSEFPVEISLSPIETEAGTLVSSAIRDVTARKRAEQKFKTVVESAPDAMVITDPFGRIVLVNTQTEKLFGYRRAELLGEPVEMLVPEQLREQHRTHRAGYARKPQAREMGAGFELHGRRKDGSEFPIEISLSPLETEDGLLTSSAIRDVTERKRLEATARLAADRLMSATESIQSMLALYDDEDRLVLCNSAYRAFFGRTIDGRIVGRTHTDVIDACLSAELFDLRGESPREFRARELDYHRDPVGTFDLRTADGRVLRVSDRRTLEGGIVSTISDMTDDVMLESELREARALAEAANSAKSEFLSSMSHEIRTPLNSILGFAQLLQRDKKSPLNAHQIEKLEHVLRGGEHLLRLIDDVLDLSRIEAGRITISPGPVGVADVLAEVKTALDPMASRAEVDLVVASVPSAAVKVVADRTRFSQVLMNYASNALKYGTKGGKATLIVSTPEDGFVRITVTDDGIGIPEDKQDKIFVPFERAGQEAGPIPGTGIGLAISKRLAELMSGRVGFRSTPGEGSEFWIDLPLQRAENAPGGGAGSAPRAAPEGPVDAKKTGRTIVYIEDNLANIAFMEGVVQELEQFVLITAPTAEAGIEIVRERMPDLVIVDINLPGMSGYEAVRRLRESPKTANIPVIALTAAAMAGDRKLAADAGFDRYLTKPVRVTELIETIEALLT